MRIDWERAVNGRWCYVNRCIKENERVTQVGEDPQQSVDAGDTGTSVKTNNVYDLDSSSISAELMD